MYESRGTVALEEDPGNHSTRIEGVLVVRRSSSTMTKCDDLAMSSCGADQSGASTKCSTAWRTMVVCRSRGRDGSCGLVFLMFPLGLCCPVLLVKRDAVANATSPGGSIKRLCFPRVWADVKPSGRS